ncbi:MAG: isocyanide synthase family protein [Bdellovibrionaceae bacterium]|nr:isocyanide synthase family protein [Pseudobdellovibrionaceae bacterium]
MTLAEASLSNSVDNFDYLKLGPHSSPSSITAIAKKILLDVMQFRRTANPQHACDITTCEECSLPHLSKIISAITKAEPVTFVLPAFPGKSPNPAKVLGPLPDMAERCALEFLQYLCDRIKQYYAPGGRIVLASDGRVFSDIVGMREDDVTNYQNEISDMIGSLGLNSISTFNLEELYHGKNFNDMRAQLMETFGESIESLKASVLRGKSKDSSIDDQEAHRLYLGITRFLVEDSLYPGQTQSRSSIQKESRIRAYAVIQRSKAWGELVERQFPDAVRLSIHPQSCGAKKLGIRLIEPDNWATPWHGVAVQVDGRYLLLKRAQAEALGAHLVTRFGRPSHYVLMNKEEHLKLTGITNET